MNSTNFYNQSKSSAFKKLKRLLNIYHSRFSTTCKNNGHLNQFIAPLHNRVPNLKHHLSIEKLMSRNKGWVKILLLLHIVKPQDLKKIFMKENTTKVAKTTKSERGFKNYAHLYNVEILISVNLELQLKNTEFAIKNKLKIC